MLWPNVFAMVFITGLYHLVSLMHLHLTKFIIFRFYIHQKCHASEQCSTYRKYLRNITEITAHVLGHFHTSVYLYGIKLLHIPRVAN